MEANAKLMLVGIGELEQQMHKKVEELGIVRQSHVSWGSYRYA